MGSRVGKEIECGQKYRVNFYVGHGSIDGGQICMKVLDASTPLMLARQPSGNLQTWLQTR